MGLFSKAVGKAKEAKGFVKATHKLGAFGGASGDGTSSAAGYQVTRAIETGKDFFDEQTATSVAMQTVNPTMRAAILLALDEYFNYNGKDLQKILNFLQFLFYLVSAGDWEVVSEIEKKMPLLDKYKAHSNSKIAEDMDMLVSFYEDKEFQASSREQLKLQGSGIVMAGGQTHIIGNVNFVNTG